MDAYGETVLSLRGIYKSFPGVRALSDVSLDFRRGEVHGLVGENGAGKSTLMKILAGVIGKDGGTLELEGSEIEVSSPLQAQRLGLSIIFQELNLINSLSVAENIFVGRLPTRRMLGVDWKALNRKVETLTRSVGLEIDPQTLIGRLSVAQKQMVEIAKALSFDSKVIMMDEPSATLTRAELGHLFAIVAGLKRKGVTVIYISHRLDEICELCDRVTIMRDGRVIGTRPVGELSKADIIAQMVGRAIENEYPRRSGAPGTEVVLEAEHLTRKGAFEDINFKLHRGEILGFAGLVGSGRTEIVRAIFGADEYSGGVVRVRGVPLPPRSPRSSIRRKLAFLTEDRKQQGLILPETISRNVSLANLRSVTRAMVVDRRAERAAAKRYVERLSIKAPTTEKAVVNLSGGNQQKVIIAKWLNTDADILILDEPTRGIDVGAKYEIYQLINAFADAGKSVIIISSELPEVINMSDRLLVIGDGRVKAVLSGDEKRPETVMSYAVLKEASR